MSGKAVITPILIILLMLFFIYQMPLYNSWAVLVMLMGFCVACVALVVAYASR